MFRSNACPFKTEIYLGLSSQQPNLILTRKLVALIIVAIIASGIGGATIGHYYYFQPSSFGGNESALTINQMVNTTSVVTFIRFITSTENVTNAATSPPSIEVKGLVFSEIYQPTYVNFIHCLPVAYVACDTYPARIMITKNFSQIIGNSVYSYYVGNYSVVVPNNQAYGISVQLITQSRNSHLTALGVLPLYSFAQAITSYNIDCFFPTSNHSLFNINCASD